MDTEQEKVDQTDKDDTEKEDGAVVTDNGRHTIHCMTIIGQIEGHYVLSSDNKTTKYEHMIPRLVEIEESQEVEGVLFLINTVGGDIEAGLAIAELIAGMKKPTVSLVLGGGHSIGVPLAVAAHTSFIVPSATMTIHPVRTTGTILGVPQAFRGLEKMQHRITHFIVTHSKIPMRALEALTYRTDELATDVGAIIDGNEAVSLGLIDELGGLSEAMEYLKIEAKRRLQKEEPN